MVDANEKDEAPKSNSSSGKDIDEPVIAPSTILSNMEEEEEEEGDNEDYEEEDGEEEEEEEGEEQVNDGQKAMVVDKDEGLNTDEEHTKGKAIGEVAANKENAVKEDAINGEDDKKAEEPKRDEELGENSKKKGKRPRPKNRNRNRNKKEAADGDKPESSRKKNASKRVVSMGMVFMCSSKTKADCFRYKILGLPANKKDQVAKIYKGMRLFLFDVDLRLMYGIFKAAGPGGYNIEPKAFKSDFPSQVRFTVLEDCLPVAEEKFKDVIKENYYTRNKFEGLLKAEQVKKLCKLFVGTGKGGARPKAALKPRRIEPVESRRSRAADDAHTSRGRKKLKRRPREEERGPHSPPRRQKRRYTDHERPPIIYEREAPVPRYLPRPLPPPTRASPVRSYGYERPLDPYIRDRVPGHHTYRVLDVEAMHHDEIFSRDRDRDWDRDRDRDPYYRDPYHEPVYTLAPEYHLVNRDYHPPAVQPPEYRLSGGSHVPGYRDVGLVPEYHSHQTHYRY